MNSLRSASRGLVAAAACLALGAGCGGTGGTACTTLLAYSLTITVTDAATGARICDATVTATDGAFSQALDKIDGIPDCTYFGPAERAGTYQVTVTKAGYMTATKTGLVVTKDECHVKGVAATIALSK